MKYAGELCGNRDHRARARQSPSIGAIINGATLDIVGEFCSFVKSLMTSANGWGSPASPTLFGPFRS